VFDGDGDRVGLISGKGEIVFPDKIMMLFAKDILDKNKGKINSYQDNILKLNNKISAYTDDIK
jgi:phosphomannomutase